MKFRAIMLACAVSLLAACGPPSEQSHGSLELTTSSVTAERGFTTTDGWNVTFKQLLVNVSAVTVAGLDGVVTASATAQIVDLVTPGPKTLLLATVRKARPWEDVSFAIGPATLTDDVAPAPVEPVTSGDVDRMLRDGLSFYVDGSASRGGVTKRFTWALTTSALFTECEGELGGAVVRGLVVPKDGSDAADIGMRSDALFSDDLLAVGAATRFDAFASADADKNDDVTLAELGAVTLESVRAANAGPYGAPEGTPVGDLRAFTEELARHTVSTFRAKGSCKAQPAPTEP
jgi:hypothetical protein